MRLRSLAVASLLAAGLGLAACGGSDGDGSAGTAGSPGGGVATPGAEAEFNDVDVAFASGMKPHHEQAVEMAELVLAGDPSPEVAELAEQIRAAQQPEIDRLEQLLQTFDAEGDHGGHGGHGDGHDGMMTEDQMQELASASGVEAERLFLALMIEHHRGAVRSAETELADGVHPTARELAAQIRTDQADEITLMERLLAQR